MMQLVRVLLVTTGITLLAGCHGVDAVAPVTPPPTVYPPADRPIIFSSRRDSTFGRFNLEIIAAKTNGSDMLNLSRNAANDIDAAWSPDGQYIAFASDRAGGFDIYVMRKDGSDVRRLTSDPIDERSPRWSPDGTKLIYQSGKDGVFTDPESTSRFADLYVIDIDGARVTNITNTPSASEVWASWSPDGKTILYTKDGVIMLAGSDGSNPHPLHAPDPGFADDVAAWSPDGSTIAYSTYNLNHPFATDTYVIFSVKADGTGLQRLTGLGDSSARFPAWSPDGKKIVYNRDALDESWGLYQTQNLWMMNADGTGDTQITNDLEKHNELGGPQAWTR
jgi:Tol biopolymer transport system component